MLDYFSAKKSKVQVKDKKPERRPSEPLFTNDDEEFLRKITSQIEGSPPPLPERPLNLAIAGDTEGNDAQLVLYDEARQVPLPDIPDTPQDEVTSPKGEPSTATSPTTPSKESKKRRWSFLQLGGKGRDRKAAATSLESAMADMKAANSAGADAQAVSSPEAKKEKDEIEQVLEQLNLASINNRVFSISDESRDVIHK